MAFKRWVPACAGMTLLFVMLAQPAFAAAAEDSLSSTKRGTGSMVPGSLGSTLRAGPHTDDPMLSTSEPSPPSAISTTDDKISNPMLSTSGGVPSSAISTTKSTTKGPAVSPALCDALTKHVPSADTNYQPGVDMNGKAVAPADAPGSPQMQLPNKIEIPLTVDLAKILKLDTTKPPYNNFGAGTEAWLGNLSVQGDSVLFNGKPLSSEQQDNLAVVCMKQR